MAISSPRLSNVTFYENRAGSKGGAMYNEGDSNPHLSNVILWGDTADAEGPEIFNTFGASPVIDHSVIQGSGGSGASWDAALGTDGGGNLNGYPNLGLLGDHGGATPTILLNPGSSAIDTGNPATCSDPATVNSLDQRGVVRPQGPACDIGAVEMLTDLIFANGFDLVAP